MNEDKVIATFVAIETYQNLLRHGQPAVGFDMSDWAQVNTAEEDNICKTTACFAGHALINEGYSVDWKATLFYPPGSDREIDPEVYGAEVLGLTTQEADEVFYLGNLDDVYDWFADRMGVSVEVLHDKVDAVAGLHGAHH